MAASVSSNIESETYSKSLDAAVNAEIHRHITRTIPMESSRGLSPGKRKLFAGVQYDSTGITPYCH